MLLVLLIISVLLILIIPNIAKQTAHIQSTGCEAQVKMINSQIEAYTLKHNRTPSNINDLINDGLIKEGQKTDREKQLQYLMVRLLRTSKINAFTLLETLLTLLILIIIIMISPSIYTKTKLDLIESELKVKNIITQLEYIKSKAIAENQSITIVFSKQATEMNIIEQNGNKYKLGLFGTKIISVAKVHTITFNNEGKINRFGSIILKAKENIYRVIFNIDKGRIRFVKLSN